MFRRVWLALGAMLLTMSVALSAAAEAGDRVVATVDGQELLYSEVEAEAAAYGYDTLAEDAAAEAWELALESCVESILIDQDMERLGLVDDIDEDAVAAAGQQAYEAMVLQYTSDFMKSTGLTDAEQALSYVEAYLNSKGYTVEYYTEYYRRLTVVDRYITYLMQDQPSITEEDIQAAYETRVSQGKTLYADDVEAFERALMNHQEAWYVPDGYRAVLQIYLPAAGDSAEEMQAAVQAKLDDIYARVERGEDFTALMAEYNEDAELDDPELLSVGYQVHRESVMWAEAFIDAAFSDEMREPGDVSSPVIGENGVHILYYLADRDGGPVELTDELAEALRETVYTENVNAAMADRLEVLKENAEIAYMKG